MTDYGDATAIRQRHIAGIVPLDPLVAGLRADAELLAQLPPVHTFLLGKHYELSSLVHDRHLSPRHGSPPCLTNPADLHVSTMSPNTCQSCPRAKHSARNDVERTRRIAGATVTAHLNPRSRVATGSVSWNRSSSGFGRQVSFGTEAMTPRRGKYGFDSPYVPCGP